MYAPVVTVCITPTTNAERPSIEKTDRFQRYPTYMVPFLKAKWGQKAKIQEIPIPAGKDQHWQLPLQPNMSPEESEMLRCLRYFGKEIFYQVNSQDEFLRKVAAVLVEENPYVTAKTQAESEMTDRATNKAAETLVKAATEAQRRIERSEEAQTIKRGPGRPRKEPIPTDA